jgi:hypothetical protein
VDGVLFCEFLCERKTELVEVGEGILDYLRAGCAAEEEGSFGVFAGLGGFLVKRAFAACVAGFSIVISIILLYELHWEV